MRHDWVMGCRRTEGHREIRRKILNIILKPTPEGAEFLSEILDEMKLDEILDAASRIIMSPKAYEASHNSTNDNERTETFDRRTEVSPRDVERALRKRQPTDQNERKPRPSRKTRIPTKSDFYRLDAYLNDCRFDDLYQQHRLMRKKHGISIRIGLCIVLGALEVTNEESWLSFKSQLEKDAIGIMGFQFSAVTKMLK